MKSIILALVLAAALASSSNGLYRLSGDEGHLAQGELEPLREMIGGATIVALGESVHASEGYPRAKKEVIQFLVEKMGFRQLAWETPWIAAGVTAKYISSCDGTPKGALKGIFGVWDSQAVGEIFTWLCQYNQKHPNDPVRFYGFDPQGETLGALERLSAALPNVKSDLNSCFGNGLDPDAYQKAIGDIHLRKQVISDQAQFACQAALDKLDTALKDKPGETGLHLRIASRTIRGFQNQLYFETRDDIASSEARDSAMAEIFSMMRAVHGSSQRTIIWAHNFHIAMNHPNVVTAYTSGAKTMGGYLKKEYGDAYFPIGLTAYRLAIHWPGENEREFELPSPTETLEGQQHSLGVENALIDTGGAFFASGKLVGFGTEILVPSEQYRAVLFLNYSPPMQAPH